MRFGIARDGDVIRLSAVEAGNRCLGGKARPMLDAVKAFLLKRDGELPVKEDRGGGVAVECIQTENCHFS